MKEIRLYKEDCECLRELIVLFSSKIGQPLSSEETIKLCINIVEDKIGFEGNANLIDKSL